MIVDLRGVNTRNKGAELMLLACLDALGPKHTFVVDPRAASVDERHRLRLRALTTHPRLPPAATWKTSRILPTKLREEARDRYGVVFPSDVDVVLDASGFTYSDQFDLRRTRLASRSTQLQASAGTPTVLLPQALGPFEEPRRRAEARALFNASRLVFARDDVSREHALRAGCPPERLFLAPDFTCLVPPAAVPEPYLGSKHVALLVPSAKMLTHAAPSVRTRYLPFMRDVAHELRDHGFDVQLLQHEQQDGDVVASLAETLDFSAPIVRDDDPRVLKAAIGSAALVAGSRFHALVSAVCQGVPSVAVGWSHKYLALLEDYGAPELVVDLADERAAMAAARSLFDADHRRDISARLTEAARANKVAAEAMWSQVRDVLAHDR